MEGGAYSHKVLCVDPGTSHLVAGIFEITPTNVKLIWNYMFKVDHEPNLMAKAAKLMVDMCKYYDVLEVLMEFQAPMGQQHVCRWNAYVEGGISVTLNYAGLVVYTLQPSAVKRSLGLSTGNYATNKQAAYRFAHEICPQVDTHHLADCFLLAEYKRKGLFQTQT